MSEHRRRPRKNTPHRINVLDNDTGRSLGRIVDITADGLMLVTKGPIEPGREFMVKILLPSMLQNRTDIVAAAKVVWCKQDRNPSFYKIGFQFVNLAGDDGFLLEDVMHKFILVG